MDKTNAVLGVLTGMYAAYIGVALWWSRSRNRVRAEDRLYELLPRRKRPTSRSLADRVVIHYRSIAQAQRMSRSAGDHRSISSPAADVVDRVAN